MKNHADGGEREYAAWRATLTSLHAWAWWLLNRCEGLPPRLGCGTPEVGVPRIRLWYDGMSFGGGNPSTLTIFEPWDTEAEVCTVREAVWNREEDYEGLYETVQRSGTPVHKQPTIAVRDGVLGRNEYVERLQAITEAAPPALTFERGGVVNTDVGSVGFEYLSKDQPAASFRLGWSLDRPDLWEPIIQAVDDFREFVVRSLDDTNNQQGSGGNGEVG